MGKNNYTKRKGVGGPKPSKSKPSKVNPFAKEQASSSSDQKERAGADSFPPEKNSAATDPLADYITLGKSNDWPAVNDRHVECPMKPEALAEFDPNDVPMQYRAQIQGRCQRQYVKDKVIGRLRQKLQDYNSQPAAIHWIEEWTHAAAVKKPFAVDGLKSLPDQQPVQILWRLISNSGEDAGFIRPVIGAGGWPVIPGSSIKGLFRRSCKEFAANRLMAWCGGESDAGETQPGLLRFHGAWPADDQWKQRLLDVVHPQQAWQVGMATEKDSHSANALASLYQPKLHIAVSSRDPATSEEEWKEIGAVMRHALSMGIGGRTSAGYGSIGASDRELLFEYALEGQGPASKLLDATPEFRPNMFRAAIRSMALRLFGGVTDEQTARKVVGRLFGSIEPDQNKGATVGLLAAVFLQDSASETSIVPLGPNQFAYAASGRLQWYLSNSQRDFDKDLLRQLIEVLHGLVMTLGGFGRSWRRPDHHIFFSDYYTRQYYSETNRKFLIGCHWQWKDPVSLPALLYVQAPDDLRKLLQVSRAIARRWLGNNESIVEKKSSWREVIEPNQLLIWTREARDMKDAVAVRWFHKKKEDGWDSFHSSDHIPLKKSDLAGYVMDKHQVVGHLWNRLLPVGPGSSSLSDQAKMKPVSVGTAQAALQRPDNAKRTASAFNAKDRGTKISHHGQRMPSPLINLHQGRFLEIVTLNAPASQKRLKDFQDFISKMNDRAISDFKNLVW
jgi:CRISPR-associated protein Cmr6